MANSSPQPASAPASPAVVTDSTTPQLVLDLENRLHGMQDQLDSVYQELSVLRARDEMLKMADGSAADRPSSIRAPPSQRGR